MLTEGFAHPESVPRRRRAPSAAPSTSCAPKGLLCEEVSVPWHRHGKQIWDVIAVEGGTAQMVDGNAYGRNWQGWYDPALIEHYGSRRRADGSSFPDTVKLVLLAGCHTLERHHGTH